MEGDAKELKRELECTRADKTNLEATNTDLKSHITDAEQHRDCAASELKDLQRTLAKVDKER